MEVFFDYACPYCMRGHALLLSLLPDYPDIEVVWRPCEAHPRPERYGPHSDLLIRGYFFARDHRADMLTYHERMYRAALVDRSDVEKINTVAALVGGIVDGKALEAALRSGAYQEELEAANRHAYDESGVWVVPAYRADGHALDIKEDVGVDKDTLARFLRRVVAG